MTTVVYVVVAVQKETGNAYPYGPFLSREHAQMWADEKFNDEYTVSVNWLRTPR